MTTYLAPLMKEMNDLFENGMGYFNNYMLSITLYTLYYSLCLHYKLILFGIFISVVLYCSCIYVWASTELFTKASVPVVFDPFYKSL